MALDRLSLTRWQQNGETYTWQGHSLFVKDTGQSNKPALLCIHGFPTASIDWQPVWTELSHYFRCITLDLLGFGLSDKPKKQPITLMQQADICTALLRQKQIGEVHLLCHDYGDSVGQELLARCNENGAITPLSCVFLNGGLFPDLHRPRLIQTLLMSPIGPVVAKLTSYKKFANTMRSICTQTIDDSDLDIYWQLMVRADGRSVLPELIKYMRERKTHEARWAKATHTPPCRTMLINGVDDPISGEHLCEAYCQRVKHADIARLEKVGHYPQVEAPDQVLYAARTFWQQHALIKQTNNPLQIG